MPPARHSVSVAGNVQPGACAACTLQDSESAGQGTNALFWQVTSGPQSVMDSFLRKWSHLTAPWLEHSCMLTCYSSGASVFHLPAARHVTVMSVCHTFEAPCSAAWKQAIAFPRVASAPCTNLVQTPPRTSSISPLDPTVAARPLTSSRLCSLAPAAHSLLLRGQHCTATGEKDVLGSHVCISSYFKCEGDSSRLSTR